MKNRMYERSKGGSQGTRPSLRGRPAMEATAKLDSGPAAAVRASAAFGLRVELGFTGTGLPQPKPTRNRRRVPPGSRWANGFKVTRPRLRGRRAPTSAVARAPKKTKPARGSSPRISKKKKSMRFGIHDITRARLTAGDIIEARP